MAQLKYDEYGLPYVWVVRCEYVIDVFFELESARERYFKELDRIKSKAERDGLIFGHEDSKDVDCPCASWTDKNGQIYTIYVNSATIGDWYKK